MLREKARLPGREAQRLETRQRVYDAAIAEFKRSGMADADIGTIITAAGVARGTFYFHFPTKEHVLAELERREQDRVTRELARFLASPHDLSATLAEVVRLVTGTERRLGRVLFREVLAFHFSPARPDTDEQTSYPVTVIMIEEIERARDAGEIYPEVDARHSAFFFLIGLYALLGASRGSKTERALILDNFVSTVLRSLEPR